MNLPRSLGSRSLTLRGALALFVLALTAAGSVGCDPGTDPEATDAELQEKLPVEHDDALAREPWQTLGTGVSYKAVPTEASSGVAPSSRVLVVFGGYTAQDEYVKRWADELVRAQPDRGFGHVYAVRGPNQSAYANREIQNSKLAAHLASGPGAEASAIVVAAHSSGSFVATELMQMLHDGRGGPGALGKVTLFNLDGGGVSGSLLGETHAAYFVYACDATIGRCSHNASTMKSLGDQYASLGGSVEVDASHSGCSKSAGGGLWCLHDTLITTRPHNPTAYDLRNDYTDFVTSPRNVVTSYFDALDR